MRKITDLQIQKKNPRRVSIYLDGEYAFGLDRLVAAWLQVGDTLDELKIQKLQAEDARERAVKQALLLLSYRARSEAEISQNLRKHEIPEEVIESTLERLRKEGFANDTQFAHAWVENRNTFRPRGRRALTVELRQKGIAESVIQSALEGLDEGELAYQAAHQKARKLRAGEWDTFRKKLSSFLARRGFTYSVIQPVVSQVWDERKAEGEPSNFEVEESS